MTAVPRPRIGIRPALGGAAAAAAVALGGATQTRKTKGMDRAVRRLIKPKRSPRVVKVAKGISYLASPHTHPWVALASSVAITVAKRRLCLSPLVASTSATLVDKAARLLVDQHRPPKATRHKGRDRFAFPSGHTCAATAIAVSVALEVGEDRPAAERALALALVGIASAAVGWSRLQLDEHWFDDVAGGWAAGIAIAIGATAMTSVRSNALRPEVDR